MRLMPDSASSASTSGVPKPSRWPHVRPRARPDSITAASSVPVQSKRGRGGRGAMAGTKR